MNRRADGDRYKSSGGQDEDENEEARDVNVSFHPSAAHDAASSTNTKTSVKKTDNVPK